MGKFIMNGVEYTSSPMNGFPPLIYSDEEREVGVWRDGKPLYQKAMLFSQGVTLSTNWTDISVNIPIDLIVYASAYRNSDGFYSILKASQGNNTGEISIRLESGSFSADVVLIQYTKTTDTAGSGRYTTYGGLTHHYSTTEQVIGTWIDGNPIYEKTLDFVSPITVTSNNTFNSTGLPIGNIEKFIDSGVLLDTASQAFPCAVGNVNNGSEIGFGITWAGGATQRTFTGLVIRYTKTTD